VIEKSEKSLKTLTDLADSHHEGSRRREEDHLRDALEMMEKSHFRALEMYIEHLDDENPDNFFKNDETDEDFDKLERLRRKCDRAIKHAEDVLERPPRTPKKMHKPRVSEEPDSNDPKEKPDPKRKPDPTNKPDPKSTTGTTGKKPEGGKEKTGLHWVWWVVICVGSVVLILIIALIIYYATKEDETELQYQHAQPGNQSRYPGRSRYESRRRGRH